MRALHAVFGFSIVGGFALLALWGLATWVLRRGPGRAFWWLLTYLQVILLVQLVVGLVLIANGGRQPILHYAYGIAFPVVVLIAAHWLAREAFSHRPWAAFSVAGFFAFGLTLRALMTGLGLG